jgi:NAD/NADP transhydrogenase beta subunit
VSDIINSLYVFVLAGFIGFEVIRRVSPLLHTPLMSLTNALDAIAVVGAIVLAGSIRALCDGAGHAGDRRRHQQRGGRLHYHRPHAQDVQDQPAQTVTMELAGGHIIEIVYLAATVLFILSLKWMSSPGTARHGVWAGEIGMLLAICGTLLRRGIVDYKWIAIGLVLGTIIGVRLGFVPMTAVPQRTALSHAFGAMCVTLVGTAEFYLRTPNVPRFMMAVISMEVILGSLTFTGSLMAAGKLQEILPQRPITYRGQNFVNLTLWPWPPEWPLFW